MERFNSGKLKKFFRFSSCTVIIGLTTGGRKTIAGGNKKRYHYCTDSSGIILYFRALQGHSGRSLIDPTLQDNVIIPDGFFKYILSCRMCNQFTFHHQFGIDTWRSKFEQQTDRILSACGSHGQKILRILIRSI